MAKYQSAEELWRVGSDLWESGKDVLAFRVMLKAARDGSVSAQVTVGYFFDCGIGTTKNQDKALYWYRKAARKDDPSAANNIATVYEERCHHRRAEFWYLRAISLGNEGAHLGLARLYSKKPSTNSRVRRHLLAVRNSNNVDDETKETAIRLLRELGTN